MRTAQVNICLTLLMLHLTIGILLLSNIVDARPRIVRSTADLSWRFPRSNLTAGGNTTSNATWALTWRNETTAPPPPPRISPRLKFVPFKLPENYTKLQIPTHAVAHLSDIASDELFGKVHSTMYPVTLSMRIRNVNEVNEIDQQIMFTVDLTLQWNDQIIRAGTLASLNKSSDEVPAYYEYKDLDRTMDAELLDAIWKPDIFIENLVNIKVPELLGAPEAVRFNQVTGKVLYGGRLRIEMECEMDFHHYPADTQKCVVALRSTNYESHEMRLFWDKGNAVFLEDCNEPNFDLQLASVQQLTRKLAYAQDTTRQYDVLQFSILARRKMSYHLVQTFLPSIFFIVITWLSFLVPASLMEAKIGITMTTLLTLTAMFASVRESTPSVSYVRAIDIWMIVCIFFVFLTLLEFALTFWLRRDSDELDTANVIGNTHGDSENEVWIKLSEKPAKPIPKKRQRRRSFKVKARLSNFLEHHSFLLFSTLFLVFNVIYWSWLLTTSEYFNWTVDHDINCPPMPPDHPFSMVGNKFGIYPVAGKRGVYQQKKEKIARKKIRVNFTRSVEFIRETNT